jgi:hypothetical protein
MSNSLAIAGVTAVLEFYLNEVLSSFPPGAPTISAVAPDVVQERFKKGDTESRVNLFLHQVTYNAAWRNECLPSLAADGKTRVGNPALALDLHYLLTAYASEDYHAEALLGIALLMLHENPILTRADISNAISNLSNLHPANDLASWLADCALAQQIELLKITPATLGREEMAWLWTALKADYRPTFPFQVSVVLIQPELPANSGPPVLTRTVAAQPNFLSPFPHLTQLDPPVGQAAATLGDTVTVRGTQLKGAKSVLLSTALQSTGLQNVPQSINLNPPNVGDTSFQFSLPNPPPPLPNQPPNDLPAGVYALSATVQTANDTLTTNSIPMAIAPKITSNFPPNVASGPSVQIPLVTCAPFVRPGQQVSLLIGGQQALADQQGPFDDFPTPTNTLSFTFEPLLPTAGKVPVWLRVDGVDSQIIDTSGPTPTYSGPFTTVT